MGPSMIVALLTLAGKGVGGQSERQLGDNNTLERCTRGIEAFPETLQSKKAQMLVFQEIIAKALNGNTPFLAHQTQVVFLQSGMHNIKALLHFTPVGEQRERRTPLCLVQINEERLQRGEIGRILRLRHISWNVHPHIGIKIKARIDLQHISARVFPFIEADSAFECIELAVNRQGCRSVYNTARFGIKAFVQRFTNIEWLNRKDLVQRTLCAIESNRIHMIIAVMEEHFVKGVIGLPQFKRSQGKFPLGACGVFDLLCISNNIATSTNQLFKRVVYRTCTVHNTSIGIIMTNLVIKPEVKIFVSTRASLWIEHQEIFCAKAELFGCHCECTRTGARLGNKRLIQRTTFLWSLSTTLNSRKNIVRSFSTHTQSKRSQ